MFSWRSTRPGVLIVAHRGASGKAPENTLASFRRAIADGAHAFELDARLTSDGRVVVIHDRTLLRTTGAPGRVEETASGVIRSRPAGRWFDERFGEERVPFLEEVLELAGGKTGVNIELKFPSRRGDPGPLVRRCLGILGEFRHRESVLVSSFHHGALGLIAGTDPRTATGLLVYPPGVPTTSGVRKAGEIGAVAVIYSGGNIRKRFVEAADTGGLLVLEYTVNTALRFRRSLRMGVGGVITNVPERIIGYARRPAQPGRRRKTWV